MNPRQFRWPALAAALLLAATAATAQNYPSRPVRFVVPYAPGGSTDTLARAIGTTLSDHLGQQVVVDNRAGANGDIGMTIVAKAPPDGYSIVLGYIANLAIGPSLYAKMPYDPVRDFASITQVAGASNIFVTHPSLPAKNFKEFIAYTKANPKKVSFASAGVASVGHLTGELLNDMAGIDMLHIPYKGSGQAISDLVGGHIKVMISGMASTLPHVRSGKLVGIVTTGLKRTPATPEIPTIAETYPGFESSSWFGVLAPAGTPKPVIARLNADIHKSLQDPAVVKRLAGVGFEITYGTPEQFTAYIKSEMKKWAKVVKASGATPG
ncbi:MAG: tripartite tricarboxylate transporter substrate binding protein [Betaproteobacteria bacterium]|jgi:tripartite-type tricarboxylate transporter receptor subunit TctC|nr:tripartite tricarboxylate transporter substrate binding protein [Betaproteobacteria bacterium]MDH5341464.1 tripartite tricarboxylate transporter substrate binding protein [Betaproteobacteria bacterium]